jgi:hypothetical protein
MATQSVQDIDSFIRLQKEKLSRDKFSDSRGGYQVSVRMLIIRIMILNEIKSFDKVMYDY